MARFLNIAGQTLGYTIIVVGMSFVLVGMVIMAGCSWLLDKLGVENVAAQILERDFKY